ncbi:MAG: OsmC family protein [Candidatus Obscuribacterales bacterium]|nr:OsmC family protein [Candidatus Obscuribacterales bacterium]
MAKAVVTSQPGGLKHEIKVGNHTLIADAGQEHGGVDAGPNPHELLLAALGSCTSMTLLLFAERRGWDLKTVSVTLSDETVEDQNGKKQTKVTREIAVSGNLNQEQLDSLKSIADKCPVHKVMTGETQIVTNLESLTPIA